LERGNEQTERERGNEDSTSQRDQGKALLKPGRRKRPEAELTKAAVGCKRSAWVPKKSDRLEGSLTGDEDPSIPTSTAVAKLDAKVSHVRSRMDLCQTIWPLSVLVFAHDVLVE
jgi:hypothetical protein